MPEIEPQACAYCHSNSSTRVEAGSLWCNRCQKHSPIDLWKTCPTCGWKLRTAGSLHQDPTTGQTHKTSRRCCTNKECSYSQTVIHVIVRENPKRGEGHIAFLGKLARGDVRVVEESHAQEAENGPESDEDPHR